MRARAVLFAFLLAPLSAADWIRLRTPDSELWTDAGEKAGREALARLARIRSLFSELRPAGDPLFLRLFLFSSEREFRDYADGAATEGFYQSGPERDSIVMHTGAGLARVVVHEYIHLLLNHGSTPLPRWFEEGLAEFYSTISEQRGRLIAGSPIPEHLAVLARERWLTSSELASVSAGSALYNERRRAGIYYAQSWALVHMLNLGAEYRLGMPRFAEAMAAPGAFRAAFGRSMDQALADLPAYLRTLRPVTVDAPPVRESLAQLERVPATEAVLARGELALEVGHTDVARRLYQRAAREHPDSPALETGLGMLAQSEGDREGARRHFEAAIGMGSRDASTWFEYAMLERDSGAPRNRVQELLEKAAAVNPNFAEARFLLGVRASDAGDHARAVEYLRAAVRILPRQSSMWHALAYALEKLGRQDEAASAARRALETAANLDEERMAQAMLESLGPR